MKTSTLPRQQFKRLLAEQTLSREQILEWIKTVRCLIIGIGMLKGGTGKTTSTIFLALYLSLCLGLKVCVVDTDDNSQSVDNWYKARERRTPPEVVPFDIFTYDPKDEEGPDFEDVLEELSESFDVVLVDVGGAGKEAYWELCKSAHMVLLPVAPSGYETSRMAPTIKVAARGGRQNPNTLKVFVTMIKCDRRTTLPQEQRAALEGALEAIDMDKLKVDVYFADKEFDISSSPDYPRSWETTPKIPQLGEYGLLFRHLMKAVAA
ncbi:division plane positioning ATPase MipZ [Streptomyces abikoensis]|uniref:nucleotide-binding protein n=1 Tax=Streptomyces abikoensis TaxID=97398 RepID=UPI003405A9C8